MGRAKTNKNIRTYAPQHIYTGAKEEEHGAPPSFPGALTEPCPDKSPPYPFPSPVLGAV